MNRTELSMSMSERGTGGSVPCVSGRYVCNGGDGRVVSRVRHARPPLHAHEDDGVARDDERPDDRHHR